MQKKEISYPSQLSQNSINYYNPSHCPYISIRANSLLSIAGQIDGQEITAAPVLIPKPRPPPIRRMSPMMNRRGPPPTRWGAGAGGGGGGGGMGGGGGGGGNRNSPPRYRGRRSPPMNRRGRSPARPPRRRPRSRSRSPANNARRERPGKSRGALEQLAAKAALDNAVTRCARAEAAELRNELPRRVT